MNKLYLVLPLVLCLFSCQEYDEDVVPLVGTYEAQVVAVSESFTMAISYDANDDIFIDALFNGIDWGTISADIDNEEDDLKRIDIREQALGNAAFIEGEGFFLDNSIQLDYTISYPSEDIEYTLVASKL